MPAGLLIIFYVGVILLPLGLSWVQDLPPRSFRDELASGMGLLALVMILAEFPLSGRFRTISRRIGMDVTMRFHQRLARTALVLALIHPFLYQGARDVPYVWDTTRQLTINWMPSAILPGLAAFLLLPALVLLAVGRKTFDYRYEAWRLMHGLGALAIAGFGTWHALAAGRYSADPALATVWMILLAIVILSLLQVYVLKPLSQIRRPWRVSGVQPVARRTWEVRIVPDGHAGLSYAAGQFVWLNIGHTPFSLKENPFSIASAPSDGPELRFIIKELGDFTRSLGQIQPGTRAFLDGPYGHLTIGGCNAPGIVLIAGGVGLAPLLGILRDLSHARDNKPLTVVYANKTADQIAVEDELQSLVDREDARLITLVSQPGPDWQGETGLVDADFLWRHFGEERHRNWLYILCGPPPMLREVKRALIESGVPLGNILSEAFVYD